MATQTAPMKNGVLDLMDFAIRSTEEKRLETQHLGMTGILSESTQFVVKVARSHSWKTECTIFLASLADSTLGIQLIV